MDISKASLADQTKWLQQRGWQPKAGNPNVFIDPDTRINYYIKLAIERALADCRVASDSQLNPPNPPRKDDAPWPKPKTG